MTWSQIDAGLNNIFTEQTTMARQLRKALLKNLPLDLSWSMAEIAVSAWQVVYLKTNWAS